MDQSEAMVMLKIDTLYAYQIAPVNAICAGHDTLVMMPTGSGKSLIYQLPALMWHPRLTVVISPLISLQVDQVTALQKKGIRARLLNSSLPASSRKEALDDIRRGELTLLYIAPEQLQNAEVQEVLQSADIAQIAVDEAHILVQCQEDFRKAYSQIGEFAARQHNRPVITAFTATATPKDREVIISSLGMQETRTFVEPIRRPNLNLIVKRVDADTKADQAKTVWWIKRGMAEDALNHWDGKGSVILYCSRVKEVRALYKRLKADGWPVGKYHGKMKKGKRTAAQEAFMSGRKQVIVATNAFGLGINKPDVRLIIHVGLPLSLDGYVQEIGRAGRDRQSATCVLIWSLYDVVTNKVLLCSGHSKKQRRMSIARLKALHKLVKSDTCLWCGIEKYFGERQGNPCGKCCICRYHLLQRRKKCDS